MNNIQSMTHAYPYPLSDTNISAYDIPVNRTQAREDRPTQQRHQHREYQQRHHHHHQQQKDHPRKLKQKLQQHQRNTISEYIPVQHSRKHPQHQRQDNNPWNNKQQLHRYNNNNINNSSYDDSNTSSTGTYTTSGDGYQNDMHNNHKTQRYIHSRHQHGHPNHPLHNKCSNTNCSITINNNNSRKHKRQNQYHHQYNKYPPSCNNGMSPRHGSLKYSASNYYDSNNIINGSGSNNNNNRYHAGGRGGGRGSRQPRHTAKHHHHDRQQQHNGKHYYHYHPDCRLHDKIINSIALNGYLRECGWSLPDYDENNNAIVAGDCNLSESETLRKRSLDLLETILCRWASSIEKEEKTSEQKSIVSITTKNNNNDSTCCNSSSNDNNKRWQRPPVKLITFGSYRLGAYRPNADVDLLALCPPPCTRDDFFTSLVTLMEGESYIRDIHPIASAYTPVLKFTIHSINFDMLFGRVYDNSNSKKTMQYQRVSPSPLITTTTTTEPVAVNNVNVDINENNNKASNDDANGDNTFNAERSKETLEFIDDINKNADIIENELYEYEHKFPIEDSSFLTGMDDSEIRSANGVRVTQYIMNYVPHQDRFRLVLCAVKEWATTHGIYSNVLGFLGGVNWAIMVAYICKRYPNHQPSSLLQIFFQTFSTWSWPKPVLLDSSPQKQNTVSGQTTMIGGGMKPWDPQTNPRDACHVMPIITPIYPRMNSAYNVGISQKRRIQEELNRAAFLIQKNEFNWKSLYHRSDFFDRHANFLQITIRASGNNDEFTKWLRLCESRLRILFCALDSSKMSVWPFAQIMKRYYYIPENNNNSDDPSSSTTTASYDDAVTTNEIEGNNNLRRHPEGLFFIALRFPRKIKSINLKQHTSDFLTNQINSWEGKKPGMDFRIQHVLQQDLPHDIINEYLVGKGQSIKNDHQTSSSSYNKIVSSDDSDGITGLRISPYYGNNNKGSRRSRTVSIDEPLQQQQEMMTQAFLDEIEIGSRPDSPTDNKVVKLEGVPPLQTNTSGEEQTTEDDISSSSNKSSCNQEQLYNFLTGKTKDLPPSSVGSNSDECTTQSTLESEEDFSSTTSPIHKRPRNPSVSW